MSLDLWLHRCLNRRLGVHGLESLLFQVIRDETIKSALANFDGLLLCLLQGKAHSRSVQHLQEGIGGFVSLLLSDTGGRGRRSRSTGFRDLLHTTVIARAEFFVHLHDSVCEFLELSAAHVAVIFLEQAFKKTPLLTVSHARTTEHLLPAMPNHVVSLIHPVL